SNREEREKSEEREAFNRLKPLSPLEAVPPGGLRTNGNFHLWRESLRLFVCEHGILHM
ncbi:hypothetical protein M9458_051811, partial [Cirrhinus mrigala]